MDYSFQDLAQDVLSKAKQPLTYQEIWETAGEMGLLQTLNSKGKTPWQTLGSILYVDVRDNEDTLFIKVGKRPTRFFLKKRSKEITNDTI